jgi:mono/diheme cytochrome c family protein
MTGLKRAYIPALALCCFAATAESQTAPKPSLFTEAQASRGEAVYQRSCLECHEKLEYTGADFRTKWNGKPVFDLFDLVRSTMPDEKPGTLSNQEYIDVVGYMMKLNGVPAGSTALPTDPALLKTIKIEIPRTGGAPMKLKRS